ncbi:MAG: hypothetical protein ACTH31_01090 [Pseudoclavibacter sp.]
MHAIKWVGAIAWLALSAALLIWIGESLFGVDQSSSLTAFGGDTTGGPIIVVGVAWGMLLTFGAVDFAGLFDRSSRAPSARAVASTQTAIAVATIIEVRRTGLTVNDVPQFDIYARVTPANAPPFTGQLRTLVGPEDQAVLQTGQAMPVRYDPEHPGGIALADPTEPEVMAALLQWRIDRGLLDPKLISARRNGIISPASVVELRPTGQRKDEQVELAIRLLITPIDGRPQWEANTTTYSYPQALGRLQVGSPVFAQYEPHDPHTVALRIEVGTEPVR